MSKKIKVLHMTPPQIKNGIYKYIFNNMKYFDFDKFQFDFLTQNKEELMKTEEYRKYHFGIRSFTTTQRDNREKFKQEIYDILSDGYDVIHLHTSSWRGFLIEEIAMELGIPKVIVHSHSTGVDFKNEEERKAVRETHEKFKAEFGKQHATHFCACSMEAAKWLYNDSINEKDIIILNNGIDSERFSFNKIKRDELRKKYDLEDKIVVGNVGRFCFQKNPLFLIDSFAKAKNKNSKLFLVMIGEGDLKEEIEKLIEEKKMESDVLLLDWQENIQDYLQMFDVFCIPSNFEGLPITVIEAQAAGLRCLVSDTITGECKITDLVDFLPLESLVWCNAINQCSNAYMRKNMSDIIKEKGFDSRIEAKKLEDIYLDIRR